MVPCDTCGDNYKAILAGRNAARDSAKALALETKEPFCICEEAGNYFASALEVAIQNKFHVVEIVSGLPLTT